MQERASGIILRVRPFTETSLIVHWLTVEQGRIATIAKGARRPKSPLSGKLDLFYEAEFSFQRSRKSELHILAEISLRDTRARLRENLAALRAAAYLTVLIEQGTETETPIPEFHELMQRALAALVAEQNPAVTVLRFELLYLELLGVSPNLAVLSEPSRCLAEALVGTWSPQEISVREGQELNRLLRPAIGTLLGKLPPQRERALRSA